MVSGPARPSQARLPLASVLCQVVYVRAARGSTDLQGWSVCLACGQARHVLLDLCLVVERGVHTALRGGNPSRGGPIAEARQDHEVAGARERVSPPAVLRRGDPAPDGGRGIGDERPVGLEPAVEHEHLARRRFVAPGDQGARRRGVARGARAWRHPAAAQPDGASGAGGAGGALTLGRGAASRVVLSGRA